MTLVFKAKTKNKIINPKTSIYLFTVPYQEFRELEFDDNDNFWHELINGDLVRKQAPTISANAFPEKLNFR